MKPFPFGSILGEFEQLVLLALLRLGNGAFGAAIHREITTRTGRELPASAVYVTLDRLEAKHMVVSYVGTPTAQRGGRRRKHYLLDTAGQRALVQRDDRGPAGRARRPDAAHVARRRREDRTAAHRLVSLTAQAITPVAGPPSGR
jgi:DNA-binding PadR family transcriptional regulator